MSNTTDSVFNDGVDIFGKRLNKKIYINHIQLMVIGEELARKGIGDTLDFWERDHEANNRAIILIAKGTTAKRIMEATSEISDIPAMHIMGGVKNQKAWSKSLVLTMFDVLSILNKEGQDLAVGVIELPETEKADLNNMALGGAAVFRGDKLVGWLSLFETRGLLYVMNKSRGGVRDIPHPQDPDKTITVELIGAKAQKAVQLTDGKPAYTVKIKQNISVGEIHGSQVLWTNEMVKKIEQITADSIKSDVQQAIHAAQDKYQSDILGFGDMLRRKYPDYWEQVKNNWHEEFAQAPVEINVEVTLEKFGRVKDRSGVAKEGDI